MRLKEFGVERQVSCFLYLYHMETWYLPLNLKFLIVAFHVCVCLSFSSSRSISVTGSFGGGFPVARAREKTPKRVTQPLPVSQTLTSCQMLPVTVTGSAFDRKIVSVLPVPFCQVLVSLWFLFARATLTGLNHYSINRKLVTRLDSGNK